LALSAWQRNRTFGGGLQAPADARSYAVEQLTAALGPLSSRVTHDAALIVSELVTNAVRADSDMVELAMAIRGDSVEVRVCDDGPGWPQPRDAGVDDTSGRGLLLVATVADEWGVEPASNGRKAVWARLSLDGTGGEVSAGRGPRCGAGLSRPVLAPGPRRR
jgi:serine/threonine-protein kinase RsbW